MTDNPAGWQSDPTGRHEHRYWDGAQWTDNVSDAGVASTDAYEAAGPSAMGEGEDAPTAAEPTAAGGWGDPTAAQPVPPSDTTATWPTSPAPPAPPVPPAPSYGGPVEPASSGPNRRLLIGGGILAVVVLAVVAFLLLGGDDDSSDVEADLASQIKAESGGELTDEEADCVAAYFVDEIGEDRMADVDFDAEDPPAGMEDELAQAAFGAISECDINPAALGGGDTGDDKADESDDSKDDASGDGTYGSDEELDALYDACEEGDFQACDDLFMESPTGSEYEEFGDTCGNRNEPSGLCVGIYEGDGPGDDLGDVEFDGDMTETLADIYEQSLGLDRDKAECLAGRLSEAINSGEMSESEAMSDVFEYLEDCDISMEEISN